MKRTKKTHACVEGERFEYSITVPTVCSRIAFIDEVTDRHPTCLVCQRVLKARSKAKR